MVALRYVALCWLAAFLCACYAKAPEPTYIPQGNPARLSEWGQFWLSGDHLRLAEDVLPYDLATPLFTDYAHKLRTIWIPNGGAATYQENEVLSFPVGTVITKTFYYPRGGDALSTVAKTADTSAALLSGQLGLSDIRLVETRVLVHRETGWAAIPYRWNKEQTEAVLHRTGDIIPLSLEDEAGERLAFNYVIPNVNQCASCHAPDSNNRAIQPIGPKVRHLNKDYLYGLKAKNQIQVMVESGRLVGAPGAEHWPKNVSHLDAKASIEARARAYLDINCSHCHSATGPADTSGLHLESHTEYGPSLGICKLAIAAGRGTGNRLHDIVPGHPEASILVYRMQSTEPDIMMPEIGRSLSHSEGVDLVSEWIGSLEGDCES